MTPERWQRLSALYAAALPLQAEDRTSFVDGATAGELDLRRELLELLESTPPEVDFLENPPVRLDLEETGAEVASAQFADGEIVCDGRFRVEHLVGRGGMGRVYKADDMSLGRTVALKIVAAPRALAESSGLRLRNEAALVSKLNHHGICTLYDLCRYEGLDIAVMEFVEGETLSARLDRGGMSQEMAVKTAMEILDALEYAHRNHVIHRDVKPSNVILTRQGAKLLDFGIAKVWRQNSTTETDDKLGLAAAGTPAYMAPERVARQQVDARADLYSLGVMLCEMLTRGTGARAIFPDVEKIAPPLLKRVVARCLADDPDARWQTAGDLREALDLALFSTTIEPVAAPTNSRRYWLGAAIVGIALVAGAWTFWPRPATADAPAVEFRLGPPMGSEFPPVERAGPTVISPDGALLAMAARDGQGISRLWLRRLDAATPVALAGTEGASHPFWAPDSKEIGFFANGKLRAVSAGGGAPRILCDAVQGRGGTWSKSGVIVFAPGLNSALYRVAESGGAAMPVTYLDRAGEENSHRWPSFLPDGDRILFVVRSSTESRSGLFVTSLDGKKKPMKLGEIESSAVFAADAGSTSHGNLLFTRGNQILAQPFDAQKPALEQEPRTVAELAWTDATTSRAPISASETGMLVYGGGYPEAFQLAWQRNGKEEEPAIDPGGPVRFVRLGPDPRRAAIERLDFRTGGGSIWLLDTMRGTPTRLTFGQVAAFAPLWSTDGKSLIYTATPAGAFEITSAPVEGGQGRDGGAKVVARFPMEQPAVATDVAKDGTIVLDLEENGNWNIVAIDPKRPNELMKLAEKPSHERQARISPDERWITYMCDESGSNQVYVAPFRGSGSRIQVSVNGGTQPSWGRASNEIYFIAPDRSLMKSIVDYAGQLLRTTRVGGPIPQLSIPGLMSGWEYAVSGPDQAIFAGHPIARGATESVAVLQGWRTHLGR